ncbi:MAG: signal peptidase I [Eubacterium sp.]|nr:signal peptidase I [Eubacterium sp.]
MDSTKKASPASVLLNTIGTLIIIIAVVLCLLLALPRLFGISGYTVLSGSMEPTIPVGSIVYARSVDQPDSLAEGDVVVFYEGIGSTPVVHRLLENHLSEREIQTKGDANGAADLMPIPYENIIGKEVLHIPFLGVILSPLGTLTGKIAMFAMILGGLLLCHVAKRLRK